MNMKSNKPSISSLFNSLPALLLVIVINAGCNKMIDVELPAGTFNTDITFKDDGSAHTAMRGIYASMMNVLGTGPFSGGLSGNLGLSSDELIRSTYSADQQLFLDNNLNAEVSSNLSSLWAPFYNYIYQANNIYVNVEKSTGITAPVKDQLTGEARFIRALCYFYLVNLYDSVPLALATDYRTNNLLSRSGPEKIYAQILEDLQYAQQKIGFAFTAQGTRLRPNHYTVAALLARVHLYRKSWAEAEAAATTVIAAGHYILDSLNGVFQTNSRETILSVGNAGSNIYTSEGGRITGSGAGNTQFRLSDYFINEFEANDQRKVKWTRTGGGGIAPFKYKTFSNTQTGAKPESTVIMRLAEQFLIRAEARAQQDKLTEAIADLDSLRNRAGLPLIAVTNPSISKDDLLQAIYHERMVELFSELGHRWFDVIRTGQANTIFKARKPGWKEGISVLYPIPASERQFNPNLTQNKGYE
ncbi:RagB/SusD family nutrient uptake outer membrane protein [Pseudoflavitalea sp. X16]|uniref:RagB/SusD family nutrient uptake outer membrane protein n=1 Tax=Paraflavitalea devenefica TaxID=2716334 RepID=UPI0014216D16|nr:RagB/SusD family nutrient uptake outer membrane protein [Paraflavitalea devenefica]NII26072.1 RagB/SusD family nutrient uptake outer membrane protein [Paraflavitalea devenefica]